MSSTTEPQYEVIEITPEVAEQLLGKNTHNRNLRKSHVSEYAEAMRTGNWLFDGTPFRIGVNGVLLDGQHRLHAIIESGTTQKGVILRGLDPVSQFVTDTGSKRSFADALTLSGEKDATNIASVATALFVWDKGGSAARSARGGIGVPSSASAEYRARNIAPSIPQLLSYFQLHAEEIRGATALARNVRKSVPLTTKVAGLTYAVFSRIDQDDADDFFSLLQTGENLSAKDPILILRNRLIADFANRAVTPPHLTLAYIIKAWNFWRDGAEISIIRYKPNGSQKETFPVPR